MTDLPEHTDTQTHTDWAASPSESPPLTREWELTAAIQEQGTCNYAGTALETNITRTLGNVTLLWEEQAETGSRLRKQSEKEEEINKGTEGSEGPKREIDLVLWGHEFLWDFFAGSICSRGLECGLVVSVSSSEFTRADLVSEADRPSLVACRRGLLPVDRRKARPSVSITTLSENTQASPRVLSENRSWQWITFRSVFWNVF